METLRLLWWIVVMWTAALLLAGMATYAVINPANAEPSPQIVNITDDPGGSVSEYYRKYQTLSEAGTEIHFHGGCYSACTMVLFTAFTGIKACADENAVFGFHKPFAEKNGKVDRTKKAIRETRKIWAMWLEELPAPLRRYLQGVRVPSATDGDEQNTLLLIPASLLLRKCPLTVAAQ